MVPRMCAWKPYVPSPRAIWCLRVCQHLGCPTAHGDHRTPVHASQTSGGCSFGKNEWKFCTQKYPKMANRGNIMGIIGIMGISWEYHGKSWQLVTAFSKPEMGYHLETNSWTELDSRLFLSSQKSGFRISAWAKPIHVKAQGLQPIGEEILQHVTAIIPSGYVKIAIENGHW